MTKHERLVTPCRTIEEINKEYSQVCMAMGDFLMKAFHAHSHAVKLESEATAAKAREVKIEKP